LSVLKWTTPLEACTTVKLNGPIVIRKNWKTILMNLFIRLVWAKLKKKLKNIKPNIRRFDMDSVSSFLEKRLMVLKQGTLVNGSVIKWLEMVIIPILTEVSIGVISLMEHLMALGYFGGQCSKIQQRDIITKVPGWMERCKVKDSSFIVMVLFIRELFRITYIW
jgi:hypothetical protein